MTVGMTEPVEQSQSHNEGKILTASELSVYVYCSRAWWYRSQKAANENQARMQSGTKYHRTMGLKLGWWRIMWIVLLLCLVVAVGLILWSIIFGAGK